MKLAGKLETTLAFPIRVEEVHVWQLVCGFEYLRTFFIKPHKARTQSKSRVQRSGS
jgi:hypothetical protein